ncbi:TPA: hypothetical protein EYP44_02085, partial [Candidatus Bathyarchaeota archaeon]|nr:hypothetical protein [Candidatus Bathyarchaeota archaeon]
GIPLIALAATVDGALFSTKSSTSLFRSLSRSVYGDVEDSTTSFVPLDRNLIVVRKELSAMGGAPILQLTLRYALHETKREDRLPRGMTIDPRWNPQLGAIEVFYRVGGAREYEGVVALFSDADVSPEIAGNRFELRASLRGRGEVTFYLLLMDNERPDYRERASEMIKAVRRDGYRKVLERHLAGWKAFWSRSYVDLPDRDLVDVWKTCLYHIRCSTTKWSVPVGILDTHWWGKYFHDEVFPYLALVSSNHVELAERVPRFRFQTLGRALRVTGGKGARYSWESTEDGDEGCPPGPWMHEIHHIATTALECWTHYLYTQDLKFLRQIAYPVIRECAEYFRLWHVYETADGRAIIGACTDLDESLFPVRNPIYTCCGAVCTFSIAAKASRMLGVDETLRPVWERLAKRLLDNLPFDGEKYVPFRGATHQSLCALGVIFPFPALSPKDERVRVTVFDYLKRCRSATGWRPTSRGEEDAFFIGEGETWIWNSAWLATCLARMGEGRLAYDVLREIVSVTDTFGSVNEARTAEKTMHHWFTTGAGAYVYALNQTLVQSTPDEIRILPAVPPEWGDVRFRLRCQGNAVIETRVANGMIQELRMESPVETHRRILIPQRIVGDRYEAIGGEFEPLGKEDTSAAFRGHFRGSLTVRFKASP